MSSELQDQTQQLDPRPGRSRESATLGPSSASSAPHAMLADELAFPAINPLKPEMDFRVDLSMFRGPLDLLLYLVRKHELDVTDIPVALITDQYIHYLEILEQLDVDSVGDFIEIASLLIEIKSRMVLPHVDEGEAATAEDDPRDELVQRLLEYKAYKDASSRLRETSHQWQQRYPRVANDLPPREVDPAEQPIHELELWDLVSAMGRIMREKQQLQPLTNIVYDDTPIQVHMQLLHDRIIREQRVAFSSMFAAGMHKTKMIGVFLAVLELARHHGVVVEQSGVHGEMVLTQGENFRPSLEISEVFSDFDEEVAEAEAAPAKPR